MHRSVCLGTWFRPVLSLVLLGANVAVPFRTATLVRVVLNGSWHHAATSPGVRVRAMTQVKATLGFRAVVGLAKGGLDETSGPSHLLDTIYPFPPPPIPPCQGCRTVPWLHPPLRC